jgi:hypothetical protein
MVHFVGPAAANLTLLNASNIRKLATRGLDTLVA